MGASLIAQLVKNLPAMQDTLVQFLSQEDPLEEGQATHSSILAWRSPWTIQSMGHKELDRTEHIGTLHLYCTVNHVCMFLSVTLMLRAIRTW